MEINASEAFDILQKEHPIFQYPMEIILGLIILAFIIIVLRKVAEKSGEDIYGFLKNKIFNKKKPILPVDPFTTPPVAQLRTPCILSASLPPRNPNFTGREDILAQLRSALTSGQIAAWKQALTGLGGTGKSQIAAEYAYRHKDDYRFVWWLSSEEPAALASNYAGLAQELDLPEKDSADQMAAIAAAKKWLGKNRNWLLIFDNVTAPEDIEAYLPREGAGHVVITSRNPNWGGSAGALPIQVFKRGESVDFIIKRTKQESREDADELADALGDLPLALEQAAAYMEERAVSLTDYLRLFRERRAEVLERGKPTAYPETIATTWEISLQAIEAEFPESVDLLKLFSFLAPDDIPKSLLIEGAQDLPEPLKFILQDSIKLNDADAALRRYSLIDIVDDSFSIHRLVQAVTFDNLKEEEKKRWAEAAVKLVNKAFPFDSDDVRTWPVCSSLLSHALASTKLAEELDVAPEATAHLLNRAGLYLKGRADLLEAKVICERALAIGEKVYGPDHPKVAICVNNLGAVLEDMGDLQGAKKHYERALSIDEKVYSQDHTGVAIDVNNLGGVLRSLGDLQGAKKHYERALSIDEKVYGPDHPTVAIRVNNLGGVLQDLGDLQGAKSCFERALKIFQKSLGEDHPKTKLVQSNLDLLQMME